MYTHDSPPPRWKIFVSHSCQKENGNPASTAGYILEYLRTALKEQCEFLISYREINETETWPGKLDSWLKECDAAFIVLDKKALASGYVSDEVSILRARLNSSPDFFIWPIFIGLTIEDLDRMPFSRLSQIQHTRFDIPSSLDEATRGVNLAQMIDERLVRKFRQRFEIPPHDMSPMGKWILAIAAQLLSQNDSTLQAADREMGLDHSAPITMAFGGRKLLARKLVNVTGSPNELTAVINAIRELQSRLKPDERSELARLLAPVWVGAERVRLLPALPSRPDGRNVVRLHADEPQTAQHYIKRANCCSDESPYELAQGSGLPTGERQSLEILEDIRESLAELLNIPALLNGDTDPPVRPPMENWLYYLIIPRDSVRYLREIVSLVHGEVYEKTIIVALTGADTKEEGPAWRDIEKSSHVIPLDGLSVDEEKYFRGWSRALEKSLIERG